MAKGKTETEATFDAVKALSSGTQTNGWTQFWHATSNEDLNKEVGISDALSGWTKFWHTKGEEYVSFLCDIGYPIMKCVMNSNHDGEKFVTAIDGINDTNIPIYIGHGDKDKTIRIDVESIYCQRGKINNLNVEYHIFEGKEHLKLIYNDELYSAINEELFQDILNFVKK